MTEQPRPPSPVPTPERRDIVIEALSSLFAAGRLEMDEFESRVDRALHAQTVVELDALVADLKSTGERPLPKAAVVRRAEAAMDRPRHWWQTMTLAFMSGTNRRGRWQPARRHYAAAVMGGVELDFREADLMPGLTDVYAFAWWGGVEIKVPPGMGVETTGLAIMGGLERVSAMTPDAAAPRLRVHALAVMGGIVVAIKRPRRDEAT